MGEMGLMTNLFQRLDRFVGAPTTARSGTLTFDQYVQWVTSDNARFPVGTLGGQTQSMGRDLVGYVHGAYAGNGIVFACELARIMLFSEARFQFRERRNGRPGRLFGTPALAPLETPTPGQTTGDLLARMLAHADLGGNAFPARTAAGIRCLRPDWVTMVLGSRSEPVDTPAEVDAELIGLVYTPGGPTSGNKSVVFKAGEFAHFAPVPDPLVTYGGMSWLTPIVREVMADNATTVHKLRFFENGATPNAVVTFDPSVLPSAYDAWVDKFESKNKGAANAYKTVYLGGGTTLMPVGKDFQQADLKAVQGAGETRIAAAAGVPAVVVGISEGLQGSSLNAGNYTSSRRRFADLTMRPLWRNAAGSLASLIDVPVGAELWYDDRDIPFLQEDVKDAADIAQVNAIAIRNLTDAGYTPDSAVQAITTGDFTVLEHSGLFSVQLQAPGTVAAPAPEPARAMPEWMAPLLAARSQHPSEGDDVRAVHINVNQPDIAAALGEMRGAAEDGRRMAALMEERAERAEALLADLAAREVAVPIVNVENRMEPVVIPAPIVENRVETVAPVIHNVVNVPDRQTVDIVSLPPMKAKVKRGSDGRIAAIEEP